MVVFSSGINCFFRKSWFRQEVVVYSPQSHNKNSNGQFKSCVAVSSGSRRLLSPFLHVVFKVNVSERNCYFLKERRLHEETTTFWKTATSHRRQSFRTMQPWKGVRSITISLHCRYTKIYGDMTHPCVQFLLLTTK